MPPKTKSSGYIFILYNGCIKVGFVRTGYLEDGDIETHLESFKEYYGNKVKGRYVKSTTPKEHFEALHETFKEFSEGKCVYKVNTTNLVNGLRDVSGSKTCKTWNVYPGSEDDGGDAEGKEVETDQIKTTKPKASVKVEDDVDDVDDAEEAEEPAKPAPKKVAPKTKVAKVEVDTEKEETKPAKPAPKKATPKAKPTPVEEEEEEEEEKPAPKAKKVVAKK